YSRARSEKLRRHISLDAPPRSDQNPSRLAGSGAAAGGAGGGSGGDSGRGSLGAGLTSREPIAHQRVEGDETRARVLDALSTLDVDSRTILILRDGRDLDYDQIAEILGVAIGTVKSRLFRARQALREAIERGNEENV
ncbi:MAG: RNA polymerase sigma factor, partial [Phycisphaerae bacterium]